MKKPLYWTLIAIFGVIFLVCAGIVGNYLWDSLQNRQLQQDLIPSTSARPIPTGTSGSTHTTLPTNPTDTTNSTTQPPTTEPTQPTVPQILAEYLSSYERNDHMVGWIHIPGTENSAQGFPGINYPVVQAPNESAWHNFYLNHDFDRNSTADGRGDGHGWIYVREACNVFEPSDNVVLYGHNMADGTMFGQVVNYRFEDYYLAHKYIHFDTLYERHTYEVIAVFLTSGTTGVGYTYHSVNNFRSAEEFNRFIADIKGAASNVYTYYDIPTTAVYGDKLLTLSTCWKAIDNGRLVVVAKRIS